MMEMFLSEAKDLVTAMLAFEELNKLRNIALGNVEVIDSNGETLGHIILEPEKVAFMAVGS